MYYIKKYSKILTIFILLYKKMENPLTEEKFIELLDSLYNKSIEWDERYNFESAESLWKSFLEEYWNKKIACEKLISSQVTKTSVSGFFTSLWWIITMPISIPADMCITFLVEMRMIVAIAYIWWHNLESSELKTIVYTILLWKDINDLFIKAWLKPLWKRITLSLMTKIPSELLIKINRKIWMLLFSKFWWKWLIRIWLAVPLIWWLIWWWINFYFTQKRWQEAIESFIIDEDVLNSDIF